MTTISPADVQSRLPQLLARLAGGEEFVVTDNGAPVARLLPPTAVKRPSPAADDITRANAAVLRHVLPGTAGGLDNAAIDADLARAYDNG